MLGGVLFLGEALTLFRIAGGLLVIGGVAIMNLSAASSRGPSAARAGKPAPEA